MQLAGTNYIQPDPDTLAKCELVGQSLFSATNLPLTCREMLATAAEMSLGVPINERDQNQRTMINCIRETLTTVGILLKDRLETLKAGVDDDRSVAVARAADADDVRLELDTAQQLLNEHVRLHSAAEKQLQTARERHQKVQDQRSSFEGNLLALALEKDVCEAGCRILDGDDAAASSKVGDTWLQQQITAMQKVAREIKLDESLIVSMPLMAKKRLCERSALDNMAAQMLKEALEKRIHQLHSLLAEPAQDEVVSGEHVQDFQLECWRQKKCALQKRVL